jgi:hypothetical protein
VAAAAAAPPLPAAAAVGAGLSERMKAARHHRVCRHDASTFCFSKFGYFLGNFFKKSNSQSTNRKFDGVCKGREILALIADDAS